MSPRRTLASTIDLRNYRAFSVADDDLAAGVSSVHDALDEAGLDVRTVADDERRWLGVDDDGVYRAATGRSRSGAPGLDRFPSDRMAGRSVDPLDRSAGEPGRGRSLGR